MNERQIEQVATILGISEDDLRTALIDTIDSVIRISSLPSVLACNSALLPCANPYNPSSDASAMGSAGHAALALMVSGVVPDLEAIAIQYRVDADELESLYRRGVVAWQELGLDPAHCRVEMPLYGTGIAGSADVAYHDGVIAAVIDWKSNRVRREYRPQLTGYAAAMLDSFCPPESGEVKVITVWLRHGEYDVATITQAEVNALYQEIEAAKLQAGQSYAPGDACTYCPRQLVCEARHEYLLDAAQALLPALHVEITKHVLPLLWTKSRLLRKAVDRYDSAMRMLLREDGAQQDDTGGMLALVETKRDAIVPDKAWPVLLDYGLTDKDLARCVTMGKAKIMYEVAKDVRKGFKGKLRAQLYESLQEAGAIREHWMEVMKHTKAEAPE